MNEQYRIYRSEYTFAGIESLRKYIESRHPEAIFVEEIALKNSGGYTDRPGLVYYQENPPEPYTNKYFAYFKNGYGDDARWVIVGLKDFDPEVDAALTRDEFGNAFLTYSRYRHDFVRTPGGGGFVDGGRDYTRVGGSPLPQMVTFNLLTKTFNLNGVTHHAS